MIVITVKIFARLLSDFSSIIESIVHTLQFDKISQRIAQTKKLLDFPTITELRKINLAFDQKF